MEFVTSADGSRIAFERSGDGPPLILLHGTGVDRHVWDDVVAPLGRDFTVYAVDRRGRGESGDADDYSVEREFEDIEALANSIDGPVNLLGHSYGAICAIGAAPRIATLRRLVLYEPPLWRHGSSSSPPAELERMNELADRGQYEEIVELYYGDMRGDPDRLETLRARSDYGRRVAAAPTLPREMEGRREFRPTPESYPDAEAPTMFLSGTETGGPIERSVEVATQLFPNSTLVELEGQGHGAMHTAPDLFVETVTEFLDAERDARNEP